MNFNINISDILKLLFNLLNSSYCCHKNTTMKINININININIILKLKWLLAKFISAATNK